MEIFSVFIKLYFVLFLLNSCLLICLFFFFATHLFDNLLNSRKVYSVNAYESIKKGNRLILLAVKVLLL